MLDLAGKCHEEVVNKYEGVISSIKQQSYDVRDEENSRSRRPFRVSYLVQW
jgi:hypothetical protein